MEGMSSRRSSTEELHTQVHVFNPIPEPAKVLPQYIAAIAANLAAMAAGCVLGWTSPALPKVSEGPDNEGWLTLTDDEASWVGSLTPLGAAIGPFLAGFLVGRVGCKLTAMGSVAPFLLSWIMIMFGTGIGLICFARVLLGVGVGMVFTVVPIYVGEISEDRVRGALGSFLQLFIVAGLLYVYCIGPYVSYLTLVVVSAAVPVAFAVAFFFVPESPYQYLAKGKRDEACAALQWLRGQSREGVQNELNNMEASMQDMLKNKSKLRDLIATKGNIKALQLSLGLVTFQQLSGINAVLFYSQGIFAQSGGSLQPEVATIIVGVVMLLASCVTPLVVDRLGRRMLLLISAVGMGISEIILGIFFKIQNDGSDVSSIGWLPVICLVVYITVYSVGFGPLAWAVMGELFPANVKSNASACTASFCWFIAFFITRFFSDIVNALGSHFAFWIFAIFTFVSAVFVYFLLPETKGKSLQEIQDILNK
ncbi:facilitated trehalose transporter Tret1-like [Periplaneta americana]|uniref:facilitated trehalose transporter Tret1-like n=1 Tax=Periplaneta americana TaxID=6978 RepID=UPI0037E91F30